MPGVSPGRLSGITGMENFPFGRFGYGISVRLSQPLLSTEALLATGHFRELNLLTLVGTPWFPAAELGSAVLAALWVRLRAEPAKARRIMGFASALYAFVCAWNLYWVFQAGAL